MSNRFCDDLIKSLLPMFVGMLIHASQVVSPTSEYLLELACKYPLCMGKEIVWNIISLPKSLLRRAVFIQLFRSIMRASPRLRAQVFAEFKIMQHIFEFMAMHNDQNKLSEEFFVPTEMQPTLFPTEPTLEIKELKIVDSLVSSSKRKHCDFMISHNNADYTLQFQVFMNLDNPRAFTYKGYAVASTHAARAVPERTPARRRRRL